MLHPSNWGWLLGFLFLEHFPRSEHAVSTNFALLWASQRRVPGEFMGYLERRRFYSWSICIKGFRVKVRASIPPGLAIVPAYASYFDMVRLPSLLAIAYAICTAGISGVTGAKYSLSDNIVGDGFYSAFEWQAISDPTHGRV